jgi:MFS family permease
MKDARLRRERVATSRSSAKSDGPARLPTRRYLVAFVLAGGLLSLGNGAIVPFFNVYLATLGLPTRIIGLVYASASLIGALCGLAAPLVSRRLGTLRAVTVIRYVPIPFFALLVPWPTVPLAVAAFLARSISISMAWPIDSTLITDLLPDAERAHAFSFHSAAWNIGFALASLLSGYAIVALGYRPAFAAYAVFCTAAVAYTALQLRDHPAAQHRPTPAPSSVEGDD